MSEQKHTPGPWSVSTYGSFATEVRSSTGRRIAATWVQSPPRSRKSALNQALLNEANAHLISAAPDLLEALKALKSASLHDDNIIRASGFRAACERAEAAIAKAEGRAINDPHAEAKAYLASRPQREPTQVEIDDSDNCGGFF